MSGFRLPKPVIWLLLVGGLILALVPTLFSRWYVQYRWDHDISKPKDSVLLVSGQTVDVPASVETSGGWHGCGLHCTLQPEHYPTAYYTKGLKPNGCWLVAFNPTTINSVRAASMKGGGAYTAKLVTTGPAKDQGAWLCVKGKPGGIDFVTLWVEPA